VRTRLAFELDCLAFFIDNPKRRQANDREFPDVAKSGERKNKAQEYRKFAAVGPKINVLTDHAREPEDTYRDSLNLRHRLGAVYDILRYPDTQTPTGIAVYGGRAAGKTTSVKSLHRKLLSSLWLLSVLHYVWIC